MTELEEDYLFHTLGYDSKPSWNSKRRENRNFFGTSSNDETINSLVENGYMKVCDKHFQETIYCATDKGVEYVERRFKEKVESAKKPTRSQRRYQAYFDWCDTFDGTFKDFLDWLSLKGMKEYPSLFEKELKIIKDFKRRWNI